METMHSSFMVIYADDRLREAADYYDNDSVSEGSSGDEVGRCQPYGWALQKKSPLRL